MQLINPLFASMVLEAPFSYQGRIIRFVTHLTFFFRLVNLESNADLLAIVLR